MCEEDVRENEGYSGQTEIARRIEMWKVSQDVVVRSSRGVELGVQSLHLADHAPTSTSMILPSSACSPPSLVRSRATRIAICDAGVVVAVVVGVVASAETDGPLDPG